MTRGMGGQSPSNVTHNLRGIDFPAKKKDLVEKARSNGAEDQVVELIEAMPDDEYGSMADVMRHYSEAEKAVDARGGN